MVIPKTFTLVHSSLADPSTSGAGHIAIIRRRSPSRLEVGCFVVDRSCLGVREAWLEEMEETGLDRIKKEFLHDDCVEKNGAWGRKLVEGAIDYAHQFGFKPSRHYKKAARVFGGTHSSDCPDTFVYGRDGKPLFVAHPNDSTETVEKIIRHLTIRCGEGNFNFIAPITEDPLSERVDGLLERIEEGATDGVKAELRLLLKRHPNSALVHFALGVLAATVDDHNLALAYFDQAVRRDPTLAEAWYNKGLAHKSLLQMVPMAQALREALKHAEPDDIFVESAESLIAFVTRITKEDHETDLEAFLTAGTLFDRACSEMEQGQWERALRDFQQVTQLDPRSYQAFGNIGSCLTQMGRINEAREALQEALRIDPNYTVARNNLKLIEGFDETNPPPLGLRIVNTSPDNLM